MTTTVNEGSAAFLTFTFKDENDVDVVPITIDWRLDDVNSGDQITDWAAIAVPAASVDVQIPPSSNAILDDTTVFEKKLVTVRVDDSLATQSFQDKNYDVRNLHEAPN